MTTEVFKRLLKSDTKVIDVGANIGYFTLLGIIILVAVIS